jgi:hypothetical protein
VPEVRHKRFVHDDTQRTDRPVHRIEVEPVIRLLTSEYPLSSVVGRGPHWSTSDGPRRPRSAVTAQGRHRVEAAPMGVRTVLTGRLPIYCGRVGERKPWCRSVARVAVRLVAKPAVGDCVWVVGAIGGSGGRCRAVWRLTPTALDPWGRPTDRRPSDLDLPGNDQNQSIRSGSIDDPQAQAAACCMRR